MSDLQPGETDLIGNWVAQGSIVVGDDTTLRIKWLIAKRLDRLAADSGGWDTLFRDARDGRLWELTYPESEIHGGGPPRLRVMQPEVAQSKYGAGAATIGEL
jgi:hypothetical protein